MIRMKLILVACLIALTQSDSARADGFDDWLAGNPIDENADGNLDVTDYYLSDPNAFLNESGIDLDADGDTDFDDFFLWAADNGGVPLPDEPAPPFSDWQADGGFDADINGDIDIIDYYIIFPDAWLAEVPEDLDGDGDEDFDDHILWITSLGVPPPPPPDDQPPESFDDWLAADPQDLNFDGFFDHIDWYLSDPAAWVMEAAEDLDGDGNADFDDYFIWFDQLDITPLPPGDPPPTPSFADWMLGGGVDANFDTTIDIIDYYLFFPDAWLAEVPEDLNGDGQFDNDDHLLWAEAQGGDVLPPLGPLLSFDEWAVSGTARDFNFDGILDDVDYYFTNGDAWVVELGEDLDGSVNIDLNDYFIWADEQLAAGPPVGDPPLPVWTFDQFLADHLGLSWNGDELIDDLDYWFADYSAWFHGPEARDIDGAGIGYNDWVLWQGEVSVAPPPPGDGDPGMPGDSEPFAGNGFVADFILDADGGGTLMMRQLPPIEIPPGTQLPPDLQVGELLNVTACWSLEGESVALTVELHDPPDPGVQFPIPPVFPFGVIPFGALDTTGGIEFLQAFIPDFTVRPEAIVRTEANPVDGVAFADAVNSGLFDGGAHVELFGRAENGMATIDDIFIIDREFFIDRVERVVAVDELTCTVQLGEADLHLGATTVFLVDPATLVEGTPLVVHVDFESQVVLQLELLDETRDYSPEIAAGFDSDFNVLFATFVDITKDVLGQDILITTRRELTSIAAATAIFENDTGLEVTDGFDLQSLVGQLIRVRQSLDPSLAPVELIVEIGLLDQPGGDPVIETIPGIIGVIEPGLTGDLSLSFARQEVLITPQTLDGDGNPFDPTALPTGEVVSLFVCWTTDGVATATRVMGEGELPFGVPGMQFPYGDILPSAEGEIMVSQVPTFAVADDAVVEITPGVTISFVDAFETGQLPSGQEVEVVLEVTPGVGASLLEVILLQGEPDGQEIVDADGDGLDDLFTNVNAVIHDIDLESCSASIQFEPVAFDPLMPFLDAAGTIAGTFDLVGAPVVVQFDPQTRLATHVQEFSMEVDYSHLFADPALETFFVVLTGIDGNQLDIRDLNRLSMAIDSPIVDDQTGLEVTAQIGGLAGLILEEPVRLLVRNGQPGDQFPQNFVVEVGINPVLDGQPDVMPPDVPAGPGPNVGAVVTADLNFDPLDQELTNFELGPGDVGQVAIYGYGLTDLAGISVKLRFDETQLNFDAATSSLDPSDPNILEPVEPFADPPVFLNPTVEDGLLTFAGSLLGQSQTAPRVDGLLGIVQFSPTLEFSGGVVVVEEVTFNDVTGTNDVINPDFSLFFLPPLGTRADVDGDGCVLWEDLFLFADAWGQTGFDSRFDFNLDGSLDELDFFVLARAFGTCSSGKLIADVVPDVRDGGLRLETIADDDGVSLHVMTRGIEASDGAFLIDYDPQLYSLRTLDNERHGAGLHLFDEEPGKVLVVTRGLAGDELLARLQFEQLVPEVEGTFRVREAAVRRTDGVLVQPAIPEAVTITSLPEIFALAPNYPNPFNSSTTISFQLPQAGATRLEIYDLLGQKIRTLVLK